MPGADLGKILERGKKIIADFLLSYAHKGTVPQNWRLFNMLDMAFLHKEGYEIDKKIMQSVLKKIQMRLWKLTPICLTETLLLPCGEEAAYTGMRRQVLFRKICCLKILGQIRDLQGVLLRVRCYSFFQERIF